MIHCRVCSFRFPEVIGYSSSFFKFALRHGTFYGWSRNTRMVSSSFITDCFGGTESLFSSAFFAIRHTILILNSPIALLLQKHRCGLYFQQLKGIWGDDENQHTLDMYADRNIHEASVAPCANCVILTASSLLSQMTNKDRNTFSLNHKVWASRGGLPEPEACSSRWWCEEEQQRPKWAEYV